MISGTTVALGVAQLKALFVQVTGRISIRCTNRVGRLCCAATERSATSTKAAATGSAAISALPVRPAVDTVGGGTSVGWITSCGAGRLAWVLVGGIGVAVAVAVAGISVSVGSGAALSVPGAQAAAISSSSRIGLRSTLNVR